MSKKRRLKNGSITEKRRLPEKIENTCKILLKAHINKEYSLVENTIKKALRPYGAYDAFFDKYLYGKPYYISEGIVIKYSKQVEFSYKKLPRINRMNNPNLFAKYNMAYHNYLNLIPDYDDANRVLVRLLTLPNKTKIYLDRIERLKSFIKSELPIIKSWEKHLIGIVNQDKGVEYTDTIGQYVKKQNIVFTMADWSEYIEPEPIKLD
jgi:hypothetical protein